MDIVQATGLLAFTTLLLVIVATFQFVTTRRQAGDQRRATAALEEQARSLAATAAASQAAAGAMKTQAELLAASAQANRDMANEMVEARKAVNPLKLRFEHERAGPGLVDGTLTNEGQVPVILRRLEILRSQGTQAPAPVAAINWGNAYLGAKGMPVHESFATAPFDDGLGDLVTIRVTGRPQDGIEQEREFLYRIGGDWTLQEIDPVEPLIRYG